MKKYRLLEDAFGYTNGHVFEADDLGSIRYQREDGDTKWLQEITPETLHLLIKAGTLEEVTEGKWVPEDGEPFFVPDPSTARLFSISLYNPNWPNDIHRVKTGLARRTKEEAIAAAEKMLAAIKT